MRFTNLSTAIALVALMTGAGAASAATYVYVSNADDGTIGMYTLQPDGALRPGEPAEAGKVVMPMSVSPDKHFLYAAVRSKPFTAITYAIDPATGKLKQLSSAPLAESYPYIYADKTGRYLLSASYGGHQVGVNAIDPASGGLTLLQKYPTGKGWNWVKIVSFD